MERLEKDLELKALEGKLEVLQTAEEAAAQQRSLLRANQRALRALHEEQRRVAAERQAAETAAARAARVEAEQRETAAAAAGAATNESTRGGGQQGQPSGMEQEARLSAQQLAAEAAAALEAQRQMAQAVAAQLEELRRQREAFAAEQAAAQQAQAPAAATAMVTAHTALVQPQAQAIFGVPHPVVSVSGTSSSESSCHSAELADGGHMVPLPVSTSHSSGMEIQPAAANNLVAVAPAAAAPAVKRGGCWRWLVSSS